MSGDWGLDWEIARTPFSVPGESRWRLRRLAVTPAQFAAIARQPGRGSYWLREEEAGYYVMGNIGVTQEEADAILDGCHPLAVLLPRLVTRALSLAELGT